MSSEAVVVDRVGSRPHRLTLKDRIEVILVGLCVLATVVMGYVLHHVSVQYFVVSACVMVFTLTVTSLIVTQYEHYRVVDAIRMEVDKGYARLAGAMEIFERSHTYMEAYQKFATDLVQHTWRSEGSLLPLTSVPVIEQGLSNGTTVIVINPVDEIEFELDFPAVVRTNIQEREIEYVYLIRRGEATFEDKLRRKLELLPTTTDRLRVIHLPPEGFGDEAMSMVDALMQFTVTIYRPHDLAQAQVLLLARFANGGVAFTPDRARAGIMADRVSRFLRSHGQS
jgi:hypothetical protein